MVMVLWFVFVVSESKADFPDGVQEVPVLCVLAGSWHCLLQGRCSLGLSLANHTGHF